MKEIALALGLDETADSAAILAKIKSLTETAEQLPQVQNDLKTLRDAQLARDAEAFADQHKTRIVNRAAAIDMFKKDPEGAKKWAETFAVEPGRAKTLNSRSARDPSDADDGSTRVKIRNRAAELQKSGTSRREAFRIARSEIERT